MSKLKFFDIENKKLLEKTETEKVRRFRKARNERRYKLIWKEVEWKELKKIEKLLKKSDNLSNNLKL